MRIVLAVGLLVAAHGAFAQEKKCPGADLEAVLRATPTCAAAHALHRACSPGSSEEWLYTQPVMEKCEAVFLARLTARQKRAYGAKKEYCSDTFSRDDEFAGTGVRADVQLCQENFAAAYAKNLSAAVRAPVPATPPVEASFNCARARSALEKTICSNRDLGDADLSLHADYVQAMRDATRDERKILIVTEENWLKRVAATCFPAAKDLADTASCVAAAIEDRDLHLIACTPIVGPDHTACLGKETPVAANR